MRALDNTVYPSEHKSVAVVNDADIYGGAHHYVFENSTGFAEGKAQYGGGTQSIQFCHKADDGTITPGLQSEQVIIALIDRTHKLNTRFPSPHNQDMITGLQMFLKASRARVEERMSRGVMGNLQK